MIRKGTYALFLTIDPGAEITVGALGTIFFEAGEYCYVGSAMGGLDQRVSRHLSKKKTIRWHIDRLTTVAEHMEAYESYPDPIPECALAKLAESSGGADYAPGFGCSDCDCRTHLFRVDGKVRERMISAGHLKPFPDAGNA